MSVSLRQHFHHQTTGSVPPSLRVQLANLITDQFPYSLPSSFFCWSIAYFMSSCVSVRVVHVLVLYSTCDTSWILYYTNEMFSLHSSVHLCRLFFLRLYILRAILIKLSLGFFVVVVVFFEYNVLSETINGLCTYALSNFCHQPTF